MNISKAVNVEKLEKSFRLPHEQHNGLKQAIINTIKQNRKKGYETQSVLKNISFDIKEGEFFGIVGRNGSGKSTLLKLLAGIYTPDRGVLEVNGKLTPFIELGVGFNPELTGKENVFLNGALLGFSKKEMDSMYSDIVEFAELEKFMDQKLKNYSSGMQVRLAFSIAIRAESDILLLDEVLAVGDAEFQRKCYDYFMSLKELKQTVILVTHDMGAVRQYCDRALLLEEGKVLEIGDPEKIAQRYQELFNPVSDNSSNKSEVDDTWGTGEVKILKPSIEISDDLISITTSYKALIELPPPVFGFTLYNKKGINVLESNTKKEKIKTSKLNKGSTTTIVWTFPNILSDGFYNLNVACCDQSTTTFYEWKNKALEFRVTKIKPTAGIVDPSMHIQGL